ncbi:hypothetical protein GCM10012285_68430 [Streptomyces kronopolitis]|uniref:DUF397 domain-containing protein n=1 Tax=Streptomyces kronopolitis TaxID=1612435 RepID=A0ABQ2K547_9ACTN|nr:DUF397 domain-containing protein [Streptomyces kronopolitis]GGN65526.1 hypothetical protein GCM10012285_68430 [Streptomyces kronopolitis]
MSTNPRTEPAWRKSSYSSGGGNCVEVASVGPGTVAVRDSKNAAQTPLRFSSATFTAFLRMVNSHTES